MGSFESYTNGVAMVEAICNTVRMSKSKPKKPEASAPKDRRISLNPTLFEMVMKRKFDHESPQDAVERWLTIFFVERKWVEEGKDTTE